MTHSLRDYFNAFISFVYNERVPLTSTCRNDNLKETDKHKHTVVSIRVPGVFFFFLQSSLHYNCLFFLHIVCVVFYLCHFFFDGLSYSDVPIWFCILSVTRKHLCI